MATTPTTSSTAVTTLAREASSEQRVLIRSMLDKHFDDAVGSYLDGLSDQRIAEKTGVPRIVVERIREAAYGPIKVDGEIQAMRAEIATIKDEIVQVEKTLDSLKSKTAALSSRLEKKLAAGA